MPGHSRKAENRRKYEQRCKELGRRVGSGIPSGGPASGIPAHPGERPATGWAPTHGATSPRIVSAVADHLREELLEVRPDLAIPEFSESVTAWSVAEARCQLLRNYSDDVGLLDDDGQPLGYTGLSEKLEGRAAKLRATLGLDPRSAATLARERAEATGSTMSLVQLAEAGRQALEARDATVLELEPVDEMHTDQDVQHPLHQDVHGRDGHEEAGR